MEQIDLRITDEYDQEFLMLLSGNYKYLYNFIKNRNRKKNKRNE